MAFECLLVRAAQEDLQTHAEEVTARLAGTDSKQALNLQ